MMESNTNRHTRWWWWGNYPIENLPRMEAHGCACTSGEIFQFNNKATGLPLWFCWPNRFPARFSKGREGGLQHSTRCSAVSPTFGLCVMGRKLCTILSIFFYYFHYFNTPPHPPKLRAFGTTPCRGLLHAKKQRAASPLDTRLSKLTQRHRHPRFHPVALYL